MISSLFVLWFNCTLYAVIVSLFTMEDAVSSSCKKKKEIHDTYKNENNVYFYDMAV